MQELAIVLLIIVVVAAVVAGVWLYQRRRSQALRDKFGAEYDRAVTEADSRLSAESELKQREKRLDRFDIRPLDPDSRRRYEERWRDLERRFVDDPSAAVTEADRMVIEVMRERSYPVESFEQRYARFPGLNLTFEVREGIVKHSREVEPGDGPELEEFLPGLRPPLEAQLIDLCDEIAYNTADLDDANAAGLLAPEDLAAGVAMFLALVSLLAGKPVRADVAMTGEISLRGLVLPIGGVKEKVLAALRAGITTVMIPKRNEKDLEDVPADARARLQFVYLERVDDAIRCAIGDLPGPEQRRAA